MLVDTSVDRRATGSAESGRHKLRHINWEAQAQHQEFTRDERMQGGRACLVALGMVAS